MAFSTYDLALQSLRGKAPELRNGAPNHAPMVAEALIALGRDDAARGWLASYQPKLADVPQTTAMIDRDWSQSLGDPQLLGAWENLFRQELANSPWADVINLWLPRLIPGTMAAGTHGIIRCGHVARALGNAATAPRLEELACALAYCAARYRTFSGTPLLIGNLDVENAVAALPLLEHDVDRRGPPPRIVKLLGSRPDFADAIQRLAPPTDIFEALGELAEIGARLYLHNAHRHPLVFLHAVTGPAAVQLLLPHLAAEAQEIAFAYTWQAIAAWAAAFGSGLPQEPPTASGAEAPWEEIIDRAIGGADEHAIKLTEACLRMEKNRPSQVFRAAAIDWVDRVNESRSWTSAARVNAGITTRL